MWILELLLILYILELTLGILLTVILKNVDTISDYYYEWRTRLRKV